jgi:hypothetical protein
MNAWRSRMLVFAFCLWVVAAADAAPPGELRAWLTALDSESYAQREAASERLREAGDAAIDLLAEGAASSSVEAAWRSCFALEHIALSGSEATFDRALAALVSRSQSGKPELAALAKSLREKQQAIRRERAAGQIRALGGRFGSDGNEWLAADGFFGGIVPGFVEIVEEATIADAGPEIIVEKAEPLERPDELRAFDEARRRAAEPAEPAPPAEPAEINVPAPPPPPSEPLPPIEPALPADVPPPADDAARLVEPPVLAEAIAFDLAGEVLIADAAGFMPGFEETTSESLVLDASWRGGDAGLAALAHLPHVVSLQISSAPLTDAALPHIASMPRLETLELSGTAFTAAGLRKFRRQRPAAQIYARGDAMLGVNADPSGPCVLSSVYYGSGAYEAGLAQGDEIVAVDGFAVKDFSDLTIAVFTHRPGDKLAVEFKRGGEKQRLDVVLKDRNALENSR